MELNRIDIASTCQSGATDRFQDNEFTNETPETTISSEQSPPHPPRWRNKLLWILLVTIILTIAAVSKYYGHRELEKILDRWSGSGLSGGDDADGGSYGESINVDGIDTNANKDVVLDGMETVQTTQSTVQQTTMPEETLQDSTQDKIELNYMVGTTGEISSNWTVIEQVAHDDTLFTQGLSYNYDKTILYETTGLYGQSKLLKLNSTTLTIQQSINLNSKYFGEGSTFYIDSNGNARIIQITWKSQIGFIYDANTLEVVSTFKYTTTPPHEGWGITYNPTKKEFIVSDGSSSLYFWDAITLEEKRTIQVTRLDGTIRDQLNELEYMNGLICANIWYWDVIICVDPDTGKSVREYDMSTLYPSSERGNRGNVLNGIALGQDHVLITGKRWDRMYKITFDDWPSLFDNV